jgi:hypothetical protein
MVLCCSALRHVVEAMRRRGFVEAVGKGAINVIKYGKQRTCKEKQSRREGEIIAVRGKY